MLYNHIGETDDIQSMIFRYAVIVEAFKTKLSKEFKVKQLSEETIKILNVEEHSEQVDRLTVLYGAGIISEDVYKAIVINNYSDYLEDVIAAENKVRIDEDEENDYDKLPYEKIEAALLLSVNSKKYEAMQHINFDTALKLMGMNHITVCNGFVKCDKEVTRFLHNMGEPLAYLTSDDEIEIEENEENIEIILADEDDVKSSDFPFVINIRTLLNYLTILDEPFGRDYIKYAIDNDVPFDDNYLVGYEHYVNDVKLTFEIKAYPRKRYICGTIINHFDYDIRSDEEIVEEVSFYDSTIKLNVAERTSDEELLIKALESYKNSKQPQEYMLVEVFHSGNSQYLIYKNEGFFSVDEETYKKDLFNFDKIWSIIQMCSRTHQIRKVADGKITIPDTFFDEIPENERVYAVNLIKEQYLRMQQKRKTNPIVQSLNSLQSQASNEIHQKEQRKAEAAENRRNRKQSDM